MKLPAAVVIAALAPFAAACSSDCTVPSGIPYTFTAADKGGNCPAAVTEGYTSTSAMVTFGQAEACTDAMLTVSIRNFPDGSDVFCSSVDNLALAMLDDTSGAGSDTSTITCNDGTSCTETFAVTLTAAAQ